MGDADGAARLRRDVDQLPARAGSRDAARRRRRSCPDRSGTARHADARCSWVRRRTPASLGVDPDRIGVAGSSAGAITALGVALNSDSADSIRRSPCRRPSSLRVRCGVDLRRERPCRGRAPAMPARSSSTAPRTTLVPYELAIATRDAMVAAGLPVRVARVRRRVTSTSSRRRLVDDDPGEDDPVGVRPRRDGGVPVLACRRSRAHVPVRDGRTVISRSPGSIGRGVDRRRRHASGPGTSRRCRAATTPGCDGERQRRRRRADPVEPRDRRRSTPTARRASTTRCDAPRRRPAGVLRARCVRRRRRRATRSTLDRGTRRRAARMTTLTRAPELDSGRRRSSRPRPAGAGYVQVLPCGDDAGTVRQPQRRRAPVRPGARLTFVRFDASGQACIYTQTATAPRRRTCRPTCDRRRSTTSTTSVCSTRARRSEAARRHADVRSSGARAPRRSCPSWRPRPTDPGTSRCCRAARHPAATANVNADARGQIVAGLAFVRFGRRRPGVRVQPERRRTSSSTSRATSPTRRSTTSPTSASSTPASELPDAGPHP